MGGMGACMVGACMAGDMHGRGMHGRGGMCGRRGCVWQEGGVHGRYYETRSMSGWYTSYWNTFLFYVFSPLKYHNAINHVHNIEEHKKS